MYIALCSTEQLFLDGLAAILESDPKLHVVSASQTIRQVMSALPTDRLNLVIVDMRSMMEGDADYLAGAQLFGRFQVISIVDDRPEDAQSNVVSRRESGARLLQMVLELDETRERAKDSTPSDRSPVTSSVGGRKRGRPRILTNSTPLSPREYEMALLVARGASNKVIAETMNLKEQTVRNVVHLITKKLAAEGRTDIARHIGMATPELASKGSFLPA